MPPARSSGAVVVARYPGNRIGWVLCAVGLGLAVTMASAGYALYTIVARLRDEVDLDTLAAELLAVIDQTMQPTRASLWLRPPGRRSGASHA